MTLIHNSDANISKPALDKKIRSCRAFAVSQHNIRILIFLQNEKLQKELINSLTVHDEFMFHVSTDLSDCVIAAVADPYQILVTDLGGLEPDIARTLAKIRGERHDLAAVLVRPDVDHLKEIECLSQGVDCVISEPLNVSLMIARIKAVMRWRNAGGHSSFKIGPFSFDMETKTLSTAQSGDINVTNKEARILKFLLSRKGMIVSRTDLLRHVWGYNSSANTHTVETHIYRLRKKIGIFVDSKTIIITEVGGYRLAK